MPIKYIPESLQYVLNSPLANKRLKNRAGNAICDNCGKEIAYDNTNILEVHKLATRHEQETGHNITISENGCRQGLIRF